MPFRRQKEQKQSQKHAMTLGLMRACGIHHCCSHSTAKSKSHVPAFNGTKIILISQWESIIGSNNIICCHVTGRQEEIADPEISSQNPHDIICVINSFFFLYLCSPLVYIFF